MSFGALVGWASRGSLLWSLQAVQSLPYTFQEDFLSWGDDICPQDQSKTLIISVLRKGVVAGKVFFVSMKKWKHQATFSSSGETCLHVYKPWGTSRLSLCCWWRRLMGSLGKQKLPPSLEHRQHESPVCRPRFRSCLSHPGWLWACWDAPGEFWW